MLKFKFIIITHPFTNQFGFGFKRNTSCNHSIFVVKETILKHTMNKSSCRIASLDAEKAFDKLWRAGLFKKLTQNLEPAIWIITPVA